MTGIAPVSTGSESRTDLSTEADAVARIARHILGTTDLARRDRLWPASQLVFGTNPLSVAYGACGTALFILDATGQLPESVREWILSHSLDADSYPPGLMSGLAGIGWSLIDMGLVEEGIQALDRCMDSPVLSADAGVFFGRAGVGLAQLRAFGATGRAEFIDRARVCGEQLLSTGVDEDGALCWPTLDGRVPFGFGSGASGIAMFLAYLAVVSDDPRFAHGARAALKHDLRHASNGPYGPSWTSHKNDDAGPLLPYFGFGSAGVGAAVLRVGALLDDRELIELARRIADSSYCRFAVFPGLMEGLSGIGELMLDIAQATPDDSYWSRAREIADTIRLFGVEIDEGLAFPDRGLERLSCSYAMGSAGIGAFLHRVANGGARRFLDLFADRGQDSFW